VFLDEWDIKKGEILFHAWVMSLHLALFVLVVMSQNSSPPIGRASNGPMWTPR
jgi:hypothetical protein